MEALSLTTIEAGYVLDRSSKGINRAIDDGIIEARTRRVGKTVQRFLGAGELRYLGVAKELDRHLTLEGQKRLYSAVRQLPADVSVLRLGNIRFDLEEVDADLSRRLDRLEALRKFVERRSSGDVIAGTDVPVHLVAALARGQTTAEIIEDYPELSAGQVGTAAEYAKVFPKLGRPYPTRSFKRMIEDAAEAGVFAEGAAPVEVRPRTLP